MAAVNSHDIRTLRLGLRPVGTGDGLAIAALLHQPDVRRYLCDDRLVPLSEVEAWIGEAVAPASASELWLILYAGSAIGLVGLQPPSIATLRLRAIGWRSRELMIALDPKHWGQGLAHEAVDAVAMHAAGDGVTFALVGCVDLPNRRSHALMRRAGFHELGRAPGPADKVPAHEMLVYERAV